MSIDKKLAKIILYNGKLYVPAAEHYPEIENPSVKCDYCGKSGLNTSIGHDLDPDNKFDICLKCASILEIDSESNKQFTLPKPLPKPLPMSSQYTNIDEILMNTTFMLQDSCRR